MMTPLSDAELEELNQFLLNGVDNDEAMTLDILDGYLHAIAIGPQTIMPSQWLPKVWGEDSAMMPPMDNMDQLNHIMGLVMRHYNSIISGFEQKPPFVVPYWDICKYETGVFEDTEGWAYGFTEGVALNRAAWKPLFDSLQGQQWYRPIGLLGEDEFSADQDDLTQTPELRQELAHQIEDSLVNIHAFWLPLRKAIQERETSQRLRAKVGRNESCPCGSGKKFKKCCGSAVELH
ncbi:MAG: YecA family protein [Comamonadaceae bacterium PBBC1]|nr:MAG: YecA family protein [Comamonadaceae bacterium PBBC1]